MGIRGLTKLLKGRCPKAFVDEEIKILADSHRRKNDFAGKIKIVVDGPTCAFEIYKHSEDMYCGGQFDAFKARIKRFVEAFKNLDISLVFFFVGEIPNDDEIKKWTLKKLTSEGLYQDMILDIKAGCAKGNKRFEWTKLFCYLTIKALYKDDDFVEIYTSPSSKRIGVMCKYAVDNDCLAILTDDSSFYIVDTIPIFSCKNLNFDEMTTTVVNHTYICEQFQCTQTVWHCMGALKYDDCNFYYYSFYNHLEEHFQTPKKNRSRVGKGGNQSNPNFELLISYIKKTAVNNDNLIETIVKDIEEYGDHSEAANHFRKGITHFSLDQQDTAIYRKAIDGAPEFINHESVVQFFKRKVITADIFPSVVEAITCNVRILLRTVPIVDPSDPIQPNYIELFRTVRQTLYGLIFNSQEIEKKSIFEMWPSVVTPVQHWPNPDVPGWACANLRTDDCKVNPISTMFNSKNESLTMLWKNKALKSPENEVIRVNCLLKCFGIVADNSLQEIPKKFHPLAVILRYMFKYPNISLTTKEVEAFVVQALLVDSEKKSWTEFTSLEERACQLAAFFVQGILLYVEISMCCCLDFEPAMPWNYFDGQRFQFCYQLMIQNKLNSSSELISKTVSNNEMVYEQLCSFIQN